MAKIGLQLYSVKDEMQKDFFGTIRRVAKMGYEGIEFAGGLMQSATAEEVKKITDETGLAVAGAVFAMEELENSMEEIIEYCRIIGCPAVVFPWLVEEYRSVEGYEIAAVKFNSFGKRLKENKIKYLYHIHGYEFEDIGGSTGMEILLKKTDPEYVGLEPDVYWVEWAGIDSVEFMKKYGSRSPYIHFKDMKDKQGKHDTEVGDGAIDMAAIAREGKKNNAEWFIVEQEEFDKPSMESAAISLRNMKRIMTAKPEFTKVVIGELNNNVPPAEMNSFSTAGFNNKIKI